MAYFMKDQFPEADMDKVIKMCLIHDMGEAFTGDIPTFYKTEADEEREERVLETWVKTLPEPFRSEMLALYDEMEELQTVEAKIYKAIDGLEAVIQHNESDIKTWIPHEYELNLVDGGNAGKGGLVVRADHNVVGQGNAEDDHVLQYDHPV